MKTDDSPEFVSIPLDQVRQSPTNPRKTFDEPALKQLAKSIEEKGVLEPILVRTAGWWFAEQACACWYASHPRSSGYGANKVHTFTGKDAEAKARRKVADLNELAGWELVAGERRWRASKLAGRTTIPALVRVLSDKEAAEIQVIENDQREDVLPLEQAAGYQRLIDLGDDVAAIAAKIGRPAKYVTARLTLTNLIPSLAEDLREGKLPFGHAHLLARLPAAEQETIVKSVELYDRWGVDKNRVISIERLRSIVHEDFTRELSAAPWKKDDETLVSEAGACNKCMKRSGAAPGLFDELLNGQKKGRDVCTDRTCYGKKQEAFLQLQIKTIADKGAEPVKLSERWYADGKDVLPKSNYEVVSKKEARGKPAGELKEAVIVEGENIGKVVTVRVKKPSTGRHSSDVSEQDRERRRKAVARGRAALVANAKVAAAAAEACEFDGPKIAGHLRAIVRGMADQMWADAARLVAKRRGLEGKKPPRDLVADLAKGSDFAPDLFGLLAELLAARMSFGWSSEWLGGSTPQETEYWKAFGVDKAKLVREAEAADKAKEKAKAAKKAAKPKAAKRKAVKA